MIAESGVPVQVGYQRRFDAAFAAAKRAVDDGSLGPLHTVRSTTMDPAPPPMDYIAGSGGIFRDCAVHDFDVLRWITGQRAVEVYATGSVQGDPRFTEYGDVDTAAIVVRFDQGTLGVVSAARYNGHGYDCRLEVHGFHDTVVAGWDQGVPVRNVDPDNDFPSGPSHHFFMDRFTDAFRAELSAFVEVVNGTAAPGVHGRGRGRGRMAGGGGDGVIAAGCPGTYRRGEITVKTESLERRSPGVCARFPDGDTSSRRTACSPRCVTWAWQQPNWGRRGSCRPTLTS